MMMLLRMFMFRTDPRVIWDMSDRKVSIHVCMAVRLLMSRTLSEPRVLAESNAVEKGFMLVVEGVSELSKVPYAAIDQSISGHQISIT
jgi:hypothetical protein